MTKPSERTARSWLLTLNNPKDTDDDCPTYMKKIFDGMGAVYIAGQLEAGEEGTPHYQMFLTLKKPCRPGRFKKVDKRLHFERVVRTPDSAADYCLKEETRLDGPWEFGKRPVQRNSAKDWEKIFDQAKTGKLDLIPPDIMVRHYGNIKRIEKDYMRTVDAPDLRGVWIHGPAGVGKSSYARQKFPDAYPKLCNKWWDGYQGQTNVIMDDVGKEHKILG